MKCPFCGANLSLEDEKCPYCGTPNPEGCRHQENLHHDQAEFEKTKQDVYTTSKRFAHLSVKTTIIAILILLNIAAIILNSRSWDIYRAVTSASLGRNLPSYVQTMDAYIEEARYPELSAFYNQNNLYLRKELKVYQDISNAAQSYSSVMYYIGNITHLDSSDTWSLKSLASNLALYFEIVSSDYFMKEDTGDYKENHRLAVKDMTDRINLMLKTNCSFTQKDLQQLPSLSENGIQTLLKRRMNIHEMQESEAF